MSHGETTFLDDDLFRPLFRKVRNLIFNFNNGQQSEENVMNINMRMNVRTFEFNLFLLIFKNFLEASKAI